MNEVYWLRMAALGRLVMGAAFLYLIGQLFHGHKALKQAAKTPFQKVLANVIMSLLGAVSLGSIMVIWVGV